MPSKYDLYSVSVTALLFAILCKYSTAIPRLYPKETRALIHYKDFGSIGNPVVEIRRSSYLHNGISYTGKMTSLYRISPLTVLSKLHNLLFVLKLWISCDSHLPLVYSSVSIQIMFRRWLLWEKNRKLKIVLVILVTYGIIYKIHWYHKMVWFRFIFWWNTTNFKWLWESWFES